MGSQTETNSIYRYQDPHLELDFVRKSAALDTHRLILTRKEYDLLSLMVQNAGEIIPRQVLLPLASLEEPGPRDVPSPGTPERQSEQK